MEDDERGNPVLINCRPSIVYNTDIPYLGNNNRSQAVTGVGESGGYYNHFIDQDKGKRSFGYSEELTVSVQNVYKAYEEGKHILANLCMSVRKGTIYGLLGSSGCGKTTLLSCIVGLKKWDSGQILLFNRTPSGAPGKRVGFMPQDIALYDQLSIREMFGYYAKLYGMTDNDVEKQWNWLVDFLQLPAKFTLVKDLSGGQQRRVSLAITLVHSPDLLILDEPTVGLDPLLRESIWKYLFNMVETRKTTVIITTHYIEEARNSNTIGVMRKGRLLVEDSPNSLLQQHQCSLLEEVVLKLSRKDDEGGRGSSGSNNNNMSTILILNGGGKPGKKFSPRNSYNVQEKMLENRRRFSLKRTKSVSEEENLSSIYDRVKAMSTVLWVMYWRHPIFMVMVLFLPTLQMLLTLAVIGTHPQDLKLGVINGDTIDFDSCFRDDYLLGGNQGGSKEIAIMEAANSSCDFKHLSCSLINELSRSRTMALIPIKSTEEALAQVERGDLWGYFSFPHGYSEYLQDLVASHKFAENETLEGSRFHLRMDMSNYMGASFAIRESFEGYDFFARKMASNCGMDPREFSIPLEYREPVYGKKDSSYQDYVIPIVILTVIFEVPMLVTSIVFISDLKQGTLDRARVAGLNFKEVMISHFITQGSVIIGQTVICTVVMILTFNFSVQGPYWLYMFLCILCGLCGESLGLLCGVIFEHELEALLFGFFLGPILLLYEGVLWPVEHFRPVIRYIAYGSPSTLLVVSARSVIYRGLNLFHGLVWPGVLVMTAWTVGFWILTILLYTKRNK